MKYLLILLLTGPLALQAQDCRLIRDTDPYTKETKLSSGFITLDGASVTIDVDSREIIVLFTLEGALKCLDNNSVADVYFEGIKSKTMARNGGTMNCEGLFQFVFRNSRSTPTTLLQRMCTRKVTHIQFAKEQGAAPVTIMVGPKEQEALMVLSNCIVNEGRALIR